MPAYCLFCETQKCAIIAQVIERCWNIYCISPEIVQRKWVRGSAQEVRQALLPGYIFLYPEETMTDPIRIPGIIRCDLQPRFYKIQLENHNIQAVFHTLKYN